jgi:flagellar basal body P-ring protein FlgI
MSNPFFVCTENFDLIKEAADELYELKISSKTAYEVFQSNDEIKLKETSKYVEVIGITSSKIRRIIALLKEAGLIINNKVVPSLWRGELV